MSRVMIAGTSSGVGKTTVICAILNALKKSNKKVISFKCGPDYIDPMFHKKVTEVESKNLDIFLMGDENVKNTLLDSCSINDIAVIEGVMGLYDGVSNTSKYSANHVSLLTKTPTILVVSPKGKSLSLCAEIKGFMDFEENNIQGILFNNIKENMYNFYKEMVESRLGIEVVGFIPFIENAGINSRHLGLVTADEISDIKEKIDVLGDSALKYCDINKIIEIADGADKIKKAQNSWSIDNLSKIGDVNIYVAKDEVFNFIYDDNLRILERLGANIKYFSPVNDEYLPDDADGVLLFGGYPEIFAEQLEANLQMKNSIVEQIDRGLLVYAECGGFMYLQKTISDFEGNVYKMLGILDGEVTMTKSLQNFGYVTLKSVIENNFLNGEINAHSFHHSKCTIEGDSFVTRKLSNNKEFNAVVTKENIFASYMHIHFFNNIELPKNIVKMCLDYRKGII